MVTYRKLSVIAVRHKLQDGRKNAFIGSWLSPSLSLRQNPGFDAANKKMVIKRNGGERVFTKEN